MFVSREIEAVKEYRLKKRQTINTSFKVLFQRTRFTHLWNFVDAPCIHRELLRLMSLFRSSMNQRLSSFLVCAMDFSMTLF